MPAKIFSVSIFGIECRTIEVEVDILNGTSSMSIVGLGDASVQESKERIRSAIKNSGAEYPRRKKTINLAPAELKKHGPVFDLPMALGLLQQSEQIPVAALEKTIAVGELSLNGALRQVNGILPMVSHAANQGFRTIIVPEENRREAALVPNIEVIAAKDLAALLAHLRGQQRMAPAAYTKPPAATDFQKDIWRFEDIRGHEQAKRALLIAAAGFHNVLFVGPPGSGKTLLARAFQNILPPLSFEEAIEVTKLYSVAGKLPRDEPLIMFPPFRALHHTASSISLVGGGSIPRPGEISLAHRGVLFLDELLEFPRGSLDCLRQPIEDGVVHVTRVAGSFVFPADFIFVAATNPCPCGYAGDPEKPCRCTPSQRMQYQKKLSGPLLDRIDLMCTVARLPFEKLGEYKAAESSVLLRETVTRCREMQQKRFSSLPQQEDGSARPLVNGKMSSKDVRMFCELDPEATRLLKAAFAEFHYSGRAYYRILKVARTIADLDGSTEIKVSHLAEALQYRPKIEVFA